MNDGLNEEQDEELFSPDKWLRELASRFCCIGTRNISMDDAMDALFIFWRRKKKLESVFDIYAELFDVDAAYKLLEHFNFADFQKTVMIDDNLF